MVDLVDRCLDIPIVKSVATNDAKTHLSSLLQEVSEGATILITRGRRPVAKLVPYREARGERPKVGQMLDRRMEIPQGALRPLTARELRAWGIE
jgi:prevent-host-death family protein